MAELMTAGQLLGVGIDVVDIHRIQQAMARFRRMEERLFTEGERHYCRSKARPHRHFAARFAAKEAALKALGTGLRGARWVDVEVDRDPAGRPLISLSGGVARLAEERGITDMLASLSFGRNQAVAVVIAVRDKDSGAAGNG